MIPGKGRSPGERNGYPLQYSCLGNPMDRGAWWATVHGVPELDTTERLTLSHLLSSDQGLNLGPRHGKLRILTTVHQGSLILGVYCGGEVGPQMALVGFISGSLRDVPCLIRCVELVLNTRREVPFWGRSVGERLRKFPPCGMDSLIFLFFPFFFKDKGPPLGQLPPERARTEFV